MNVRSIVSCLRNHIPRWPRAVLLLYHVVIASKTLPSSFRLLIVAHAQACLRPFCCATTFSMFLRLIREHLLKLILRDLKLRAGTRSIVDAFMIVFC